MIVSLSILLGPYNERIYPRTSEISNVHVAYLCIRSERIYPRASEISNVRILLLGLSMCQVYAQPGTDSITLGLPYLDLLPTG